MAAEVVPPCCPYSGSTWTGPPRSASPAAASVRAPDADDARQAAAFRAADEGDGSAYAEDWIAQQGGTAPATAVDITLSIGGGESALEYELVMAEAASWEVCGLGVRQEGFASSGFRGTVRQLVEKAARSVEQVRAAYPAAAQPQFDLFLRRVAAALHGSGRSETKQDSQGSEAKCELLVCDPSGLSGVYDDNGCAVGEPRVAVRRRKRSYLDVVALGLEKTVLVQVSAEVQQHNAEVDRFAALFRSARRVVALTGAGISVESGIPPFRAPPSPAGGGAACSTSGGESIWGRFDATKMTVQGFNGPDPTVREYWWALKHSLLPKFEAAAPNPAHRFLGRLQDSGKLHRVITQNIDSLHQAGGVPNDKMIELHGHMRGLICSDNRTRLNPLPYRSGECSYRCSHDEARETSYFASETVPTCPCCGAPLRTESVMFGQPMPNEELQAARDAVAQADLLLVVGSTLIVEPANTLPGIALLQGTPVVMINFDETKYDRYCRALVRQPAGEFLQRVGQCLDD